jgi:hypothetical protein
MEETQPKLIARKGSSAIWYTDGFTAAFTALGKSPEVTKDLKELLLELQNKANELVEKYWMKRRKGNWKKQERSLSHLQILSQMSLIRISRGLIRKE